MRLRPNDAPEMELGEKRNCSFKLSGAVGVNTISSATVTASNMTVGTVSTSGTTVSVPLTATATGNHMVKVSATLSSAEIIVGVVRVKVVDSTQCETGARY